MNKPVTKTKQVNREYKACPNCGSEAESRYLWDGTIGYGSRHVMLYSCACGWRYWE